MKQPDLTYTSHNLARVNKAYPFFISLNGYLEKSEVPEGYNRFNGMGGGSFLLGLIGFGRFGYQNPAVLVHDYVYEQEGKLPNLAITRQEADRYLCYGLRQLGYSKRKCKLVYRIVRLIGIFYWFEI
jgi:hypothetical protein